MLSKRIAYSGFKSLDVHSLITGNRPTKFFPSLLQAICAVPSFGLTYTFGMRLTTHSSYAYILNHSTGNVVRVPIGERGHSYIYSTDREHCK